MTSTLGSKAPPLRFLQASLAARQQNQAQSVQQIIRSGWAMMRFQILEAWQAAATTITAESTCPERKQSYQTMH